MSSKEGPHAVGIRTSANNGRAPTLPSLDYPTPVRGDGMSSKEEPHAVGIRTSANNGEAATLRCLEFTFTQTEVRR